MYAHGYILYSVIFFGKFKKKILNATRKFKREYLLLKTHYDIFHHARTTFYRTYLL